MLYGEAAHDKVLFASLGMCVVVTSSTELCLLGLLEVVRISYTHKGNRVETHLFSFG